MRRNHSGLAASTLLAGLVGLGGCARAHDSTVTGGGVSDPGSLRARLLALTPVGTPALRAAAAMRAQGFSCQPARGAAFDGQPLGGDTVDYLWCMKSVGAGPLAARVWRTAHLTRAGAVTGVVVHLEAEHP